MTGLCDILICLVCHLAVYRRDGDNWVLGSVLLVVVREQEVL
jgi:hypothetical protein